MEKTLDCMGLACPLPVVNAKKALEGFTEDGTLRVLVDNETAVSNLKKLAASSGLAASSAPRDGGAFEVAIQVKTGGAGGADAADSRGAVVVISANTMGGGDEALGKTLMKAFLFALTNVTALPEQIIFYNSGAFLACEGSDSLEDLKNLEAAGVKISVCGTCLNFYGLTDKLRVGSVTNMYDIAEALTSARLIIRP